MGIDSLVQANALPSADTTNKNILGKDDFLKLMLIQMKNQDPLNPMDNQAMLAQMAQFSTVEQMGNLNKNFTNSAATQGFMQAAELLGKDVEIIDPASSPDEPGTLTSQVKSVRYTNNGPVMTLQNGMVASVDDILTVSESESAE